MRARLRRLRPRPKALPRRPRVFFEEWDEPHISAIRWVSQLMGIAGGTTCFPSWRAVAGQGPHHCRRGEIVRRNPDIIIGSWCGKKFRPKRWRRARGGRK
jgi:iron complex transport system substrate-binding protein